MTHIKRRCLLGTAAALTTVSATAAPAQPDALLIETCHRFAEAELEDWYRYCTAAEGEQDEDSQPDWATLHWITATPATTPEGWQAKALAYAAWDREAFDDPEDERDSTTPIRASLLRDMVSAARNLIIGRLRERYGPLSEGYTANGMWLGRRAEPVIWEGRIA